MYEQIVIVLPNLIFKWEKLSMYNNPIFILTLAQMVMSSIINEVEYPFIKLKIKPTKVKPMGGIN
jgi:hypothetical protein